MKACHALPIFFLYDTVRRNQMMLSSVLKLHIKGTLSCSNKVKNRIKH